MDEVDVEIAGRLQFRRTLWKSLAASAGVLIACIGVAPIIRGVASRFVLLYINVIALFALGATVLFAYNIYVIHKELAVLRNVKAHDGNLDD